MEIGDLLTPKPEHKEFFSRILSIMYLSSTVKFDGYECMVLLEDGEIEVTYYSKEMFEP